MKPASASRSTGADADVGCMPEAHFYRDGCWPYTMSTNIHTGTAGSIMSQTTGSKQLLPLSEYLSLVSKLPPQTRLKFSPYGVPRSARATMGTLRSTQ
jgi:hypothetical protein